MSDFVIEERGLPARPAPTAAFLVDLQLPDFFRDRTIEEVLALSDMPADSLEEARDLVREHLDALDLDGEGVEPWDDAQAEDPPAPGYRELEQWVVDGPAGMLNAARISERAWN